jgi:hypothetical protein
MRARIGFVILCVLAGGQASAQAVRGVAISRDSLFVAGVIATLVDSLGRPVARALADDEGRFTLRAPAPGVYRIDARRIGFRPTLGEPLLLEEGKVRLHTMVLTGAPVPLSAINTVAAAQCESRVDSTSAAFAVWEEARKALLSSQLTRLTRAYKVDVTTYVRKQGIQLTPSVDSATRFGLPIRPFTSKPPEVLAEQGYITRGDRAAVFHAPDEEVLLSDSFAGTHCLRLLPDSNGAPGLRLGFSPVPGRRVPEISGVLTIDRETNELHRLDFSFVNLPAMDVVGTPGGSISFRRLPEGSWLIEEWAIWVPIIAQRAEAAITIQPPTRNAPVRPPQPTMTTKVGLQTTGGHVIRVAFGDETVWMRRK